MRESDGTSENPAPGFAGRALDLFPSRPRPPAWLTRLALEVVLGSQNRRPVSRGRPGVHCPAWDWVEVL
jgi:hypothetical protein